MRKLISLMHVSLDGYCGGPKGEMDWIAMNDAIFADAGEVMPQKSTFFYPKLATGLDFNSLDD